MANKAIKAAPKSKIRQARVVEGGSVYEDTIEEIEQGGSKKSNLVSRRKVLDLTLG